MADNMKDKFNKSKEIIGKKFDQLMGSENNVVI